MGARAWVVGGALILLGCAGDKSATKKDGSGLARGALGGRRFVDKELGFEITRPVGEWEMDAQPTRSLDGVAVPVVMHHPCGAQVVLQVAPTVATPTQFAERLHAGFKKHPGFSISEPEPMAYSDNAVGFRFLMNDGVRGKVAILEGRKGHTYLLLATWPKEADGDISGSIEAILGSLRAL